jgi:hypothetical protein
LPRAPKGRHCLSHRQGRFRHAVGVCMRMLLDMQTSFSSGLLQSSILRVILVGAAVYRCANW